MGTKFKIITDQCKDDLENGVNSLLSEGWKLHGTVFQEMTVSFIDPDNHRNYYYSYSQAMVKEAYSRAETPAKTMSGEEMVEYLWTRWGSEIQWPYSRDSSFTLDELPDDFPFSLFDKYVESKKVTTINVDKHSVKSIVIKHIELNMYQLKKL